MIIILSMIMLIKIYLKVFIIMIIKKRRCKYKWK
uniref:Uncharacterized protein n=1 Tax=CrAss-like virus sp. ctt4r3 TaxID=2823619 RepID=A0A8S5L7D9_9CAUD|nr:MAG TPA: hypothetical protein [CrAss-like virus sp. ctt4r3]